MVFDLIDQAAQIKDRPRQWIVETGAVQFAQQIVAQQAGLMAAARRRARQWRRKIEQ